MLYDLFISAVLVTIAILTISKWGVNGVLITATAATIWLLAGDTLMVALDFTDYGYLMDPNYQSPPPSVTAWIATIVASVLAITAIFTRRDFQTN